MSQQSPVYVDYDKLLSKPALRRQQQALRKVAEYMIRDDFIKLAGGYPSPEIFPIVEADIKLQDGSIVHIDRDSMAKHLQYGMSEGYPDLREWMIEFQRRLHSPPTFFDPNHPGRFDLVVNNGATESLYFSLELLMDEGDWVLTEDATYPAVLSMVEPFAGFVHGIKSDAEGIVVDDMERVLTSWNDQHPGSRKPRVIYAVPYGGNPTGVTWSLDRMRALYDVARAHDLIIIEDAAYVFLQFERPLRPSLLSMDIDGRVIRVDSFSKIIAPGMRVAVVSGPKPLLNKMRLQKDLSSLSSSGLSQVTLAHLLRHWGYEGFLRYADSVMEFYKTKANIMVQSAKRHLTGLAEWNEPCGGMFMWLHVPGLQDCETITDRLLERKVVMIAGVYFSSGNETKSYIRVSFAMATEEECDKAFSILADTIRAERALQQ